MKVYVAFKRVGTIGREAFDCVFSTREAADAYIKPYIDNRAKLDQLGIDLKAFMATSKLTDQEERNHQCWEQMRKLVKERGIQMLEEQWIEGHEVR
jgi:hypothetical protein